VLPLIYIDACALQRVFDPCVTAREQLEVRAMERIFEAVEQQRVDLVWSAFLTHECIVRMPAARLERRQWAEYLRGVAKLDVGRRPELSRRAIELQRVAAIKPLDALHLGSAESVEVPFITVDRNLLDRVLRAHASSTLVMDPFAALTHLGLSLD
jgi:predicted nucleic acid-binding protein